MAADMTDETIAQYMERIEKMSIKEIQKEIEFLESPGYNCEGLVCADGDFAEHRVCKCGCSSQLCKRLSFRCP